MRKLETLAYKKELSYEWSKDHLEISEGLLCKKKIRFVLRDSPKLMVRSLRDILFNLEYERSHVNINALLNVTSSTSIARGIQNALGGWTNV